MGGAGLPWGCLGENRPASPSIRWPQAFTNVHGRPSLLVSSHGLSCGCDVPLHNSVTVHHHTEGPR